MPKHLGDVRCWVNSGKHMLSLSFSGFDPGCVKTPMANFRVELPSRFRRCKSRFVLATTFGRRQLRKRFCASLARASFHTAWDPSLTLGIVGPAIYPFNFPELG